jgi:O-antigen/teichoic acid export membrane protein
MADSSSYRGIFKATSIFGGVQVINIVVTLLKGKVSAEFLGPEGMGVSALFISTLTMITTLFGLGLNTSAVRTISQAQASGDLLTLSRTVKIFRLCLALCAIAGSLFLIVASPLLSWYTFGNVTYSVSFMLLSLMLAALLFTQGNTSLLQGTHRLKETALSSLTGAVAGLAVSVPLFYYYGVEGIVPALIISALATYAMSRYYASKVMLVGCKVTKQELTTTGYEMAKLGIALIAAQLVGQLVAYLVNAYISTTGSLDDVGFFQAGMGMTYHAVAMIFVAMGADYYPRLAAVSNDVKRMNETVNRQGEIVLLIAFPILLFMMVFAPLLIRILLASEFMLIASFIRLLCLGMLLKTISYAMGYISFAKGDRKAYLWLEGGLSNTLQLSLNILGYTLYGLKGLAISFVFIYLIYIAVLIFVVKRRYGFVFLPDYRRMIGRTVLFSVVTLGVCSFCSTTVVYTVGSLLCVLAAGYSLYELNRRIALTTLVESFRRK